LSDVTLVGNDSGGAMSQVTVTRHPERIGRLVLTNCDTHENFPPGIFKTMPPLAKLPGGMAVLAAPFRIPAVARAAFRPFTRNPLPPELIASWMEPGLHDPDIKRDLKKVTVGMNKRYTLEAAEKLKGSDLPVLLTWAPGDRLFPLKYAERLTADMPNARLVQIPDARTFVPIDQPQRLADEIATFVGS
jgi:pimeloyl-ACP methyl ester carboxylesterase